MNKYSGFTLLELLITIGIAGIVMALAIPNISELIKNERLVSASNNLLADLMLARSKAVERNQPVIVCASSDEETCTNDSYEAGWIVIIDTDSNGTGDELIKVQQITEGGITYKSAANGLSVITFDGRGFLPSGSTSGTISICDDRLKPNDFAKTISLSPTGRAGRRGAVPSC